jgi:AbrB family looped-hinge helix DNA binding protein
LYEDSPSGGDEPVKLYYLITVTSKGQFTIPKAIRERLGVRPGDRVSIDVESDQFTIRPLRHATIKQTVGSSKRSAKEVSDQ